MSFEIRILNCASPFYYARIGSARLADERAFGLRATVESVYVCICVCVPVCACVCVYVCMCVRVSVSAFMYAFVCGVCTYKVHSHVCRTRPL